MRTKRAGKIISEFSCCEGSEPIVLICLFYKHWFFSPNSRKVKVRLLIFFSEGGKNIYFQHFQEQNIYFQKVPATPTPFWLRIKWSSPYLSLTHEARESMFLLSVSDNHSGQLHGENVYLCLLYYINMQLMFIPTSCTGRLQDTIAFIDKIMTRYSTF